MPKKLNSMPEYTARMPKQPHDVSQSFAYTTCPGMLNPVYYDMLHHGDEIHFSASHYLRMNPMVTQALGQIDVHLDYFFVPLGVIYTPAPSMFYQTDDLISSALDEVSPDMFPTVDSAGLTGFFNYLSSHMTANGHYNVNQSLPAYFDCLPKSIARMFDFFDLGADAFLAKLAGMQVTFPEFTPWFNLAYKAVYQLYFRNDDRERKNYFYNIDKYSSNLSINIDLASKESIFEINYANRPKDYFTSVKVSPLGSSVSMLNGQALVSLYSDVNYWLSHNSVYPSDSAGVEMTDLNGVSTDSIASYNSSDYGSISANSIRQLFMVDKLLRVVGRAEKNYESQFLAHYGIKIPHDVMHNITHIGHDMVTLKPDSIISTAETFNASAGTGAALGEIGGQCSGMLTGSKKNFKAPFHGVFLCISHVIPRRRYVLGLNRLHDLTSPNKFWQPEFDKKGMEPLFGYEANFYGDEQMSQFFGWRFGYEYFKRKADKVSRAFKPSGNTRYIVNTYSPWVIASTPFGFIDASGSNQMGYTPSQIELQPYNFFVAPTDLNVNMVVPYNPAFPAKVGNVYQYHQIYQTDPFICDFNMHIKKVNSMSTYSEPEL